MVDRIVLAEFHQTHQVRKLNADRTLRFQQCLDARNKIIQIRNVGQHIVRQEHIRSAVVGNHSLGKLSTEEIDDRRDAMVDC